jgi:hypothetical protein
VLLGSIKHIERLKENNFTKHKSTQGDIMKLPKVLYTEATERSPVNGEEDST